jgi:hypothetical protein
MMFFGVMFWCVTTNSWKSKLGTSTGTVSLRLTWSSFRLKKPLKSAVSVNGPAQLFHHVHDLLIIFSRCLSGRSFQQSERRMPST